MSKSAREIIAKIDSLEPTVAQAFRDALQGIRSNAQIERLARALEAGDVEGAMRAAGITAGAFTLLTEGVRSVYVQAGTFWASDVPSSINFGFDVQNPRAVNFINRKGAEMVKIMEGESRDVIRSAINDVVSRGVEGGANPKKMALDLVGRVDRTTGRRIGGQISLTNNQAQWVRNAQQELRSGNRAMMSNYLSRKGRDKRFDSIVKKAMEKGEGLSAQDINRISGKYSDNLLKHRAEMIARTETNRSFQEAQQESLRQLVDEWHVNEQDVRKIWDATMDMNTRPTHAAANGQAVGMNDAFDIGGYSMMHPLDGSLGAPGSEIIGCRCFMRQDINYLTEDAARG